MTQSTIQKAAWRVRKQAQRQYKLVNALTKKKENLVAKRMVLFNQISEIGRDIDEINKSLMERWALLEGLTRGKDKSVKVV